MPKLRKRSSRDELAAGDLPAAHLETGGIPAGLGWLGCRHRPIAEERLAEADHAAGSRAAVVQRPATHARVVPADTTVGQLGAGCCSDLAGSGQRTQPLSHYLPAGGARLLHRPNAGWPADSTGQTG